MYKQIKKLKISHVLLVRFSRCIKKKLLEKFFSNMFYLQYCGYHPTYTLKAKKLQLNHKMEDQVHILLQVCF